MAEELFHITTAEAWSAAQERGEYRPASLQSEGFIHLSRREQVAGTLKRFFKGKAGLVLLVIDEAQIEKEVKYEEGEPGQLFPHLYAVLPVSAVVRTLVIPDEPRESFVF